jgi:hypothetical protein
MMAAKLSGRLAQAQHARRKRPGTAKNYYRMAEMIEKIAIMSDPMRMRLASWRQPSARHPSRARLTGSAMAKDWSQIFPASRLPTRPTLHPNPMDKRSLSERDIGSLE